VIQDRYRARSWSPEEDAELQDLLGQGASWAEISDAMERSIASVQQRANRNRRRAVSVYRRDWTEDEDAKLLSLRAAGVTWTNVALALNRTSSSCKGRMDRLQVDDVAPPPPSPPPPDGPDYVLVIRLPGGDETTIARGPEDDVRGIHRRMSRTIEGLRVELAAAYYGEAAGAPPGRTVEHESMVTS